MPGPRKPRADGERTREAIVREAVSLATVDGLEGLSIGNLAARARHEQERRLRPLRLEAGSPTRHRRRSRTDLPGRGHRTGARRRAGTRSARRRLRRLLRPPRAAHVPRRLLLRRRRPGDGHPPRSGQGTDRRVPERVHRADPPVRRHRARAARASRRRGPRRAHLRAQRHHPRRQRQLRPPADPAALDMARNIVRRRLGVEPSASRPRSSAAPAATA